MSYKIKHLYEFENFRLDAENPSLWREGKPVLIAPKALETLILLVRKPNEIVSRDELLDTIWKDTFVEEGNINYTISNLRKTLENKELIQTVPRRGYRFIGEVRKVAKNGSGITHESPPLSTQKIIPPSPVENIPAPPVESSQEKFQTRWILISVILVSALFVTSFAYLRRETTTIKPPDNPPTANQEAQQAFTRGRMILARRNVENREEKAIDEFQSAVTLDPTFAAGYAGLAGAYNSYAAKLSGEKGEEAYAKARVAAEKSLALDARLSEGYLARGWVKRQADWDWAGAESDLRLAVQLDPRNATAHQRLALLLCNTGKLDEALSEVKIANELDPIADYVLGARFPILEARREYETALKESEQVARENKTNFSAARAHATFLYHTGNFAKVIELGEEILKKDFNRTGFAWLSLMHSAYRQTGQPEKADETLRQLETLAREDTKALYSLAMNYAELGRLDDALIALENCFERREERMCWLKVEPRFKDLQNNQRFQQLIKKMNL